MDGDPSLLFSYDTSDWLDCGCRKNQREHTCDLQDDYDREE